MAYPLWLLVAHQLEVRDAPAETTLQEEPLTAGRFNPRSTIMLGGDADARTQYKRAKALGSKQASARLAKLERRLRG